MVKVELIEPVDFVLHSSESWLFRSIIDELSRDELGIGFIYRVLERLAEKHGLHDAVVTVVQESCGTQAFRLGNRSLDAELLSRIGTSPGLYCEPASVPEDEREAVRMACQLALSTHLARFRSERDWLTSISNRRSFDAALKVAAARSARYGWAFTLVVIDLNEFKRINDRAGHVVGDDVLRQFGLALRRSVRSGDTAARIGGDEFAVILNNAEGSEASGFIDRVRAQVKTHEEVVDFTTGTAVSPRDSTDPKELLRIADARLYEKRGIALT